MLKTDLRRLSLAVITLAVAGHAHAETYPDKPLRLIVPFPPGGGNDIIGRAVAQRLTEVIKQQVVVDNRGGAGGALGVTAAATAQPDGYTLLLGSLGMLAHNPALKPDLPYHPIRDFAPVTLLVTSALVLAVYPAMPAKSVQELVALAKASPGKLSYASAGPGSSLHMTGELFKHTTGTDILHVPYKGTGPALIDLIGGRVDLIFSTMPPAVPLVKSGKLRALGVSTEKRASALPEVPTIAEAGVPGFVVSNWQGIVVPVKTPVAITRSLNRDLLAALKVLASSDTLASQGLEAAGGTPEQFGVLIRTDLAKYVQLVKATGIRVE
jgi:tripartite-type tricarboxylate transporter receptor subunit TctC